jgi:hypothetical protein
MLHSNCMKVKTRIQQYILEQARNGLEGYLPQPKINYDGYCTEQDIAYWPITTVDRIFRIEKSYEIKRIGRYRAFIDWLQGLCSALPVYDGYYTVSRQRLAEWLEQTEAESMRYEDEEVDAKILHLFFREFTCLLEKEQKKLNGKNKAQKNG